MKRFCILFIMIPIALIEPACQKQAETLPQIITATIFSEVIAEAEWSMSQEPVTLVNHICYRSAGSSNEFYSEGDYWWPDPKNPDGPYIRRDGETNPDNFVAHRQAVIRLSKIVGSLTSAYIITKDEKYAEHAITHLNAWFVNPETSMKPHLLYAQAIKGRVTGRGIGIIDTIHLIEVAKSIPHLMSYNSKYNSQLEMVVAWFKEYTTWLTTHPYGLEEREAKNNHGTCWVMQVAAFAQLTKNETLLNYCRERYKKVLLPNQMAKDGSFPLETSRTKPYGYSLFNLDAFAVICQLLSTEDDNLWLYSTEDELSISLGIDYMTPFIKNKDAWPFMKDVMYWDYWPIAHPFLVLSAVAYDDCELLELWKKLDRRSEIEEVNRNWPVKNPILWF